ncbi:MAG: hypothetical protein ACD_60C00091G0001 [uncultured bacterium]|nr:MAG: hypothetical protein ACD_60C00091G0001 [uncultured bacterium]
MPGNRAKVVKVQSTREIEDTLEDLITKRNNWSTINRYLDCFAYLNIAIKLVEHVQRKHDRKIYGQISSQNFKVILENKQFSMKENTSPKEVPWHYQAPEFIYTDIKKAPTAEGDFYTVGVILKELLWNRSAYSDPPLSLLCFTKSKEETIFSKKIRVGGDVVYMYPGMAEINQMMNKNPHERPSLSDIKPKLQHLNELLQFNMDPEEEKNGIPKNVSGNLVRMDTATTLNSNHSHSDDNNTDREIDTDTDSDNEQKNTVEPIYSITMRLDELIVNRKLMNDSEWIKLALNLIKFLRKRAGTPDYPQFASELNTDRFFITLTTKDDNTLQLHSLNLIMPFMRNKLATANNVNQLQIFLSHILSPYLSKRPSSSFYASKIFDSKNANLWSYGLKKLIFSAVPKKPEKSLLFNLLERMEKALEGNYQFYQFRQFQDMLPSDLGPMCNKYKATVYPSRF